MVLDALRHYLRHYLNMSITDSATPIEPGHSNDSIHSGQLNEKAKGGESQQQAITSDAESFKLLISRGDLRGARLKLIEIINLEGDSPQHLLPLGLLEGQLGNFEAASEIFKKITEIDDHEVQAWMGWGLSLQNLNQYVQSIQCYIKALEILNPPSNSNLNATQEVLTKGCLDQLCQLETQLKQFPKALIYAKRSHEVRADLNSFLNLVQLHLQTESYNEAVHIIGNAIACYPSEYRLYVLKGMALEKLNSSYSQQPFVAPYVASYFLSKDEYSADEIMRCYDKAIQLNSEIANTYYIKANFLSSLGNWRAAVTHYEKAIGFRSTDLLSINNLIVAHQALGQIGDAMHYVEKFIQTMKSNPELVDQLEQGITPFFFNAGALALLNFEYEKARKFFEEALLHDWTYPQLLGAYLHLRMRLCDWHSPIEIKLGTSIQNIDLDQLNKIVIDSVTNGRILVHPFALLGVTDEVKVHKAASLHWSQSLKRRGEAFVPEQFRRRTQNKIRLGYFSSDFKEHATAYLMASLFELHDRSCFEIFAYSWGTKGTSTMRNRLSNAFDQWFEVDDLQDAEIASLARSHGLDIAFDLKGYTQGARTEVFALRVAPVQIAYLGYPGEMNAEFIDYCIADEIIINKQMQLNMREKVLYMPRCYQVNDLHRQISDVRTRRSEHGLPEQGLIYCCFNGSYKITPEVFSCWMSILSQTPGSVLWLLDDNKNASRNLLREAQSYGVDSKRIIFAPKLPQNKHLERLTHADLFLDTFPCNAHTTASDALWAGVPILSMMGESIASRVCASLLVHTGLFKLVTKGLDEYRRKACELGLDPAELKKLKSSLLLDKQKGSLALFDARSFAHDFEKILKTLLQ